MKHESKDLEAKKAEWTAIQLDIAKQAIFEDHNLSFEVINTDPANATASSDVNHDLPKHERHHALGTIHGLHTIAGLDISFFKDVPDEAIATLAVLSFPDLKVIHSMSRKIHLDAPYIPSFLAMREAHHFVALIDELRTIRPEHVPFPQVFLIDGNGRLHEREAGLATVVGVQAGVPTIGCAKDYHPVCFGVNVLPEPLRTQKGFKSMCKAVLKKRGDWIGIDSSTSGEHAGAALYSSPHAKGHVPIFISSGHYISLETAIITSLACCKASRVPEPVRQADLISREEVRTNS